MNDVAIVTLVFAARDGLLLLLAGWIIYDIVRGKVASSPSVPAPQPVPTNVTPPVFPPVVPGPPVVPAGPVSPPVVVPEPPVVVGPKNKGIIATDFGGGNDSTFSRTSAYDGKIINGDTELGVALPAHGLSGRIVRVFYNGKTVDAPVRDVGPWNGDPIITDDPYWKTGARPQAESGTNKAGKETNRAGIDLTPAVWAALGYVGNPRTAKAKVDWDFADYLDGKSPAPASTTTDTVPAHLALMRRYRDLGVHADHDSAYIMAWPSKIGAKFPEMADYVNSSYKHDTTPWCGLAMADVFAESGIRPQFGATDTDRFLWADSWRQFGTAVETPQPGDVLVFRWAGGGHHVTLYDHETPGDFYACTGGNQGQGHVVSTENMAMANCIAIRRPAVCRPAV